MMARALSTLWVLMALGCVVVSVLATSIAEPFPPFPADPFWLAWVGLPLVGAFILVKRPGNTIGAIVLAIGICAALSAGSNVAAYHDWAPPEYLVLVNQVAFSPLLILVPLLLLTFPSGILPSPRWRIPVVVATVLDLALIGWFLVRPVEYSFDNIVFYQNPLGVESLASFDNALILGLGWSILGFVVAVIVHVLRHYRKTTVQERLQIKWVVAPALIAPIFVLAGMALEEVSVEIGNVLVMTGVVGGANGIAAGIGVAILRHQLYGIDRIISRTVSYLLVVVVLGLVLLGLVSLFALFLPSDDPLVVAVSTLVVFALFAPVRHWVQTAVDRRFNRSRYDAADVVESLSGLLRDRVDPEGVVDDWMDIVEETMQPALAGVWVRERMGP